MAKEKTNKIEEKAEKTEIRRSKTDIENIKDRIEILKKHVEKHKHDYKPIRQLVKLEARIRKIEGKKGENASVNI